MPSSTFKLNIAEPCLQSWDEMTVVDGGRFCHSCSKTVTDFTSMSDEAIQNYFLINTPGTCGRFKQEQLDRITIQIPSYIFHKSIATWKKYLVILLICFGTNICATNVAIAGPKSYYTDVKKQQHKKKKTKRKKYTNIKWEPSITEVCLTEVLGNMIVQEVPSRIQDTLSIEEFVRLSKKKEYEPYINSAMDTKQKEPLPEKQKPSGKMEFILPQTALDLQRRIIKKK